MSMCAIAGIIGLPCSERIAEQMLTTMKRRGPDSNACCQGDGYTLLHARLAIIDPEGGAQPMTLEWAGNCYRMVYNGELYNTQELRSKLLILQVQATRLQGILLQGFQKIKIIAKC